jgi:hypothetical protein
MSNHFGTTDSSDSNNHDFTHSSNHSSYLLFNLLQLPSTNLFLQSLNPEYLAVSTATDLVLSPSRIALPPDLHSLNLRELLNYT